MCKMFDLADNYQEHFAFLKKIPFAKDRDRKSNIAVCSSGMNEGKAQAMAKVVFYSRKS